MEVFAPWHDPNSNARFIKPSMRHLTLAFYGDQKPESIPKPPFHLGKVAKASQFLFLPENKPRVIAYNVEFFHHDNELFSYAKELGNASFLPHITIAREPFDKDTFKPPSMPLMLGSIHLYESLGNLSYKPLETYPLILPFEEIPHTADIAFLVRGKNLTELCTHAQIAMSFAYPELLTYCRAKEIESFHDIVVYLNEIVAKADIDVGSPIKAVSFAGDAKKIDQEIYEWEMIIDI